MSADSPINILLPGLNESHFRLAPERRDELAALIAERNISIHYDNDTHQMRFDGADLFRGIGLVYVGIRGLERLWAHTYGMIHVYRRIQAVGFAQLFDLNATEEGRVAGRLMDWAIDGEVRGNPAPWPSDLPHPLANPTDDQNLLTNEVFYGVIGFAVLHEFGHIVRQHHGEDLPKDILYRHEFEADEWAYDWIMDRWRDYTPHTPLVLKKRCTLIAGLFSLLAINHARAPRDPVNSEHPHSAHRLLRFLIKHANEENGVECGLAWSLPTTAIGLHVTRLSADPWPTFDDFRDHLNEIRRRFPYL